jgi:hypothetical protein
VGEQEQPDWLADKLAEVAKLPTTALAATGQRGRACGLKHFRKEKGVQRLAAIILAAA